MNYRTCGKCKGEFFAEFRNCPHCGQEYSENHRKAFMILGGVAFLLVAAIAYEYVSVSKEPTLNPEPDAITKEVTESLDDKMARLPDVRQLEEKKAQIEERIKELSNKLEEERRKASKMVSMYGVMNQMGGGSAPQVDTSKMAEIDNSAEAKMLKEEEAKLDAVLAQLKEIGLLHREKGQSEERMTRLLEAGRLFRNNSDADRETLAAIKNSLISFKSTEPEYQEAQKFLAFINEKIAAKDKKENKKRQAIEKERFEAETASLSDRGKGIKRAHPEWTAEECDLISKGQIKMGMLEEQVREAWGKPFDVKKTRTERGTISSKWTMVENSSKCVFFEDGICVAFRL